MKPYDAILPLARRHVHAADLADNRSFDHIVALAAKIFSVAATSLTVSGFDRQFMVASQGLGNRLHPVDTSPTYEIVARREAIVIGDLAQQSRYRSKDFYSPETRFFAGVPLILPDGFSIGCLALADPTPRDASSLDLALLNELASLAVLQLEINVVVGTIDPVSRLPNRAQFILDIADMAAQHADMPAIAVLIDIVPPHQVDAIMRALGPAHLDQAIVNVVNSFRVLTDDFYRLYQVSAKQLALLPPMGTDLDHLRLLLRRHLAGVNRSQLTRFAATVAAGIVPFILGATDAPNLLRMASSAAQDARQAHDDVGIYSSTEDRDHQRRFEIVRSFATALEKNEGLYLLYQPRVDLASGRCYAAEALLRWTHADLGPISPGEFIPLIDPTMMIHALTDWVMRTALDHLAQMRQRFADFIIAINVSAHNLREDGFMARLLANLDKRALPPQAIEIEITEGSFILDDGIVMATLHALAGAGVRIAIDDFGTGYSSLAYLEKLPAHTVKLDQSFMHGMTEDRRKHGLVRSTISLCHELGHRVVAEGVETMEIATQLLAAGCDEVQGYGFSRPITSADLTTWLEPRYGLPDGHNAYKAVTAH